MTIEITERVAQRTELGARRVIRDSRVPGFVLRVGRTTKTFAVVARDLSGVMRTITIGTYPELSVKEARTRAQQICSEMKQPPVVVPEPAETSEAVNVTDPTITLRKLLAEAEIRFSKTHKGWKPRGPRSELSAVRRAIETVFAPLLDWPVEEITAQDLANVVTTYQRKRQEKASGKTTANGGVSRAMAYLATPLHWAAHRGRYRRIGAGRYPKLNAPDIRLVVDPAQDDPTLEGCRTRVLTIPEFVAIYPLLRYPRPAEIIRNGVKPEDDYGFIALRFVLLTAARISEVAEMTWAEVDWLNGVWIKSNVKGHGAKRRTQALPLSDAALDLLRSLPKCRTAAPRDLVFPTAEGGPQKNWDRVSRSLQTASGTTGWTRHDLRRTASTVMLKAGVPVHIIETVLNHRAALQNAGGSASASHYLVVANMWSNEGDPVRDGLDRLAKTYDRLMLLMADRR